MANQEGKIKSSFQKHIKHENTANTTKLKNDLKTAELTIYIWGRGEDLTEKCKVAEL